MQGARVKTCNEEVSGTCRDEDYLMHRLRYLEPALESTSISS